MKNYFLIAIVISVVVSCKSEQQKFTDRITQSEKELFSDSSQTVDHKKAEQMISLYKEYADKFKDDTLAAEYLFRAGDVSNGIGKYRDAVELYGKCSRINNYSKQAVAFFLQGFIYETQLGDTTNAKRYYEEFLVRYPNHKLAEDVKFSLANLGKSPEELVKMFEEKDSLATVTAKQ